MKRWMTRLLIGLIGIPPVAGMLFSILAMAPERAEAEAPYHAYYIGPDYSVMPVPVPYEPDRRMDLDQENIGGLKKPQDLFIDGEDRIYVADTGNNRIVVTDPSGTAARIVGEGVLRDPRGVFVDDQGQMYVADAGNRRIVKFAADGSVLREFPQPESPLLGDDFIYQPVKVVVNSYNYIFVVSQGSEKGLLMLDQEGNFRGFFGANRVEATFTDILLRLVYTREQRRGSVINLPYSFNNVAISHDGYIYTTTTGLSSKQVRKLNAVGGDIYPDADRNFADPTLMFREPAQNFIDVAVDRLGNMTLLDKQWGHLYQYDASGRMMFAFGSNGEDIGEFAIPSSIAVDSQGIIYVLDEAKNTVHSFRPTRFARLVQEANRLYNEGRYEESIEPWREVLKLDSYYELALQAIGQSLLREGRYDEAMYYFRQAYDKANFSKAYYEKRKLEIRGNFEQAATPVVLGAAALFAGQRWMRRRGMPLRHRIAASPLGWFRLPLRVMFHPVQGFEALRYEDKGRVRDGLLLILLYLIVEVLCIISVSFLYEERPIQFVNWTDVAMFAIVPWLLWSVVHYGITTIADGEGRFRDVLTGTAYCFMPWIVFSLPIALVTNLLTLQEKNFVDLFTLVINAWVVVLLYFKIRETHNYSTWMAVWIMFCTVIGCLAVIGLFFIMAGMSVQTTDFVRQLFKEVTYIGR